MSSQPAGDSTWDGPHGRMLRLVVRNLDGSVLGQVYPPKDVTAASLKELIRQFDGTPLERLRPVAPNATEVRGKMPLSSFNLQDNDEITRIVVPMPRVFDAIGECDDCEDYRYVLHGFLVQRPQQHVVSLCESCLERIGREMAKDPSVSSSHERNQSIVGDGSASGRHDVEDGVAFGLQGPPFIGVVFPTFAAAHSTEM